jgi:hypothetical protein
LLPARPEIQLVDGAVGADPASDHRAIIAQVQVLARAIIEGDNEADRGLNELFLKHFIEAESPTLMDVNEFVVGAMDVVGRHIEGLKGSDTTSTADEKAVAS